VLGEQRDLQAQRAARESLLANFEPPEDTRTRPVNTDGMPGPIVSPDPDEPPTTLCVHGGSYVLGSAYGYRPLAGALAQTWARRLDRTSSTSHPGRGARRAPLGSACPPRARLSHGVSSELDLYPAAAHSFHLFWTFLPEAIGALDAAATFARDRTSRHGPRADRIEAG
jgi:acetyl esterase/lipase